MEQLYHLKESIIDSHSSDFRCRDNDVFRFIVQRIRLKR